MSRVKRGSLKESNNFASIEREIRLPLTKGGNRRSAAAVNETFHA